jgi:hypothetical protein
MVEATIQKHSCSTLSHSRSSHLVYVTIFFLFPQSLILSTDHRTISNFGIKSTAFQLQFQLQIQLQLSPRSCASCHLRDPRIRCARTVRSVLLSYPTTLIHRRCFYIRHLPKAYRSRNPEVAFYCMGYQFTY